MQRSYYNPALADIRVRIDDTWRPADEAQRAAYIAYKSRPTYYVENPNVDNGICIFRENNDPYNPTYFKLEDSVRNAKHPIIDFNDIRVFLMDGVNEPGNRNGAGWVKARNYQAWAYIDFMYDINVTPRKCYMSKYSTYLAFPPGFNMRNVTTIDIDGLPPNIIFSMSRNENNSVYYERNDHESTRVRICDNEYARAGFLGFFTRITMDVGIIITPPPSHPHPLSANADSASGASVGCHGLMPPIIKTIVEEEQCILCYENKKNTKFLPCGHTIACYHCTQQLVKSECPVCKTNITNIRHNPN
jgi:hypothetical protein